MVIVKRVGRLGGLRFTHIRNQIFQIKPERNMKNSSIKSVVKLGSIFATAFMVVACQPGFSAQEKLEQANLEKAIYCMEILEVELDVKRAGRECFGENYVQHTQHVPDGKDGLLTYFEGRIKKFPEMKAEIKRASADGDLVWIHVHFKRTPDVRGNAVINIFRMDDGKFVEHWGAAQAVPETSVHGNSMF